MFTAPLFKLVEECGEAVLVLADGLQECEFLRSRLTRTEVLRLLRTLAETLGALPEPAHAALPEIDWAGWRATALGLGSDGAARDAAAWFAVQSLVPATLSWLRLYRRSDPALFDYHL